MTQCKKPGALAILAMGLVLLFAAGAISAATVKTGSFYEVKIETARGENGAVTATITTIGKNGHHCNMLYPWKLTIDQQAGLTVSNNVMKKADAAQFTEAAVVFRVPYTATETVKTVTASLKLSLCDDKQCQMETVPLSWPAR